MPCSEAELLDGVVLSEHAVGVVDGLASERPWNRRVILASCSSLRVNASL